MNTHYQMIRDPLKHAHYAKNGIYDWSFFIGLVVYAICGCIRLVIERHFWLMMFVACCWHSDVSWL
jgi:hypothetical protein